MPNILVDKGTIVSTEELIGVKKFDSGGYHCLVLEYPYRGIELNFGDLPKDGKRRNEVFDYLFKSLNTETPFNLPEGNIK